VVPRYRGALGTGLGTWLLVQPDSGNGGERGALELGGLSGKVMDVDPHAVLDPFLHVGFTVVS
jgi:hypothetical protein